MVKACYKRNVIVLDEVKPGEPIGPIEKECKGIALMEVFDMVHISHTRVTPENQSGTVKLISTSGEQYLYNIPDQSIDDVDLFKPALIFKDDILVSAKAPTCSFTQFCMLFDLFSGDYKGDIKIIVDWDFIKRCKGQVVCLERRIRSRDRSGEIAVRMGLFANATVATLTVTLSNYSAGTGVYGLVVASNSKLNHAPNFSSVLFVKKCTGSISLGENGMIPLSKSRVGVPLDSFLHVDMSLFANDVRKPASVSFKAQTEGESTQVDSLHNMITVNVKWDAKEDSVTAEYDTIFDLDAHQQSEFETLYGPFENLTEDSDSF